MLSTSNPFKILDENEINTSIGAGSKSNVKAIIQSNKGLSERSTPLKTLDNSSVTFSVTKPRRALGDISQSHLNTISSKSAATPFISQQQTLKSTIKKPSTSTSIFSTSSENNILATVTKPSNKPGPTITQTASKISQINTDSCGQPLDPDEFFCGRQELDDEDPYDTIQRKAWSNMGRMFKRKDLSKPSKSKKKNTESVEASQRELREYEESFSTENINIDDMNSLYSLSSSDKMGALEALCPDITFTDDSFDL